MAVRNVIIKRLLHKIILCMILIGIGRGIGWLVVCDYKSRQEITATLSDPLVELKWKKNDASFQEFQDSGANITIVSAFFDIGVFQKGGEEYRDRDTYKDWMTSFGCLQNPVVFYSDSKLFLDAIERSRKHLSAQTKLVLIERNSSWAFKSSEIIKQIFSDKHYPKHYPNTVNADYSCSMHAKYDVVERTALENTFHTKYFAWLDVGYFRYEKNLKRNFILKLPKRFNSSQIAVTRVQYSPLDIAMSTIIRNNLLWIGGGLFLAERKLMLKYIDQYKRAFHFFLSKGLMNTDQQLLYAMYSLQGRMTLGTSLPLQLYGDDSCFHLDDSYWFYLGNMMRTFL